MKSAEAPRDGGAQRRPGSSDARLCLFGALFSFDMVRLFAGVRAYSSFRLRYAMQLFIRGASECIARALIFAMAAFAFPPSFDAFARAARFSPGAQSALPGCVRGAFHSFVYFAQRMRPQATFP